MLKPSGFPIANKFIIPTGEAATDIRLVEHAGVDKPHDILDSVIVHYAQQPGNRTASFYVHHRSVNVCAYIVCKLHGSDMQLQCFWTVMCTFHEVRTCDQQAGELSPQDLISH
jgi:hypothetical protein